MPVQRKVRLGQLYEQAGDTAAAQLQNFRATAVAGIAVCVATTWSLTVSFTRPQLHVYSASRASALDHPRRRDRCSLLPRHPGTCHGVSRFRAGFVLFSPVPHQRRDLSGVVPIASPPKP